MTIALSGNDLTFEQLYAVALRGEKVALAGDAVARMKASRAVVERVLASGATAYGINTGFGKLASVRISSEQVRQLQVNLVRSHASGVGLPLSEAETRAMLLLRFHWTPCVEVPAHSMRASCMQGRTPERQ